MSNLLEEYKSAIEKFALDLEIAYIRDNLRSDAVVPNMVGHTMPNWFKKLAHQAQVSVEEPYSAIVRVYLSATGLSPQAFTRLTADPADVKLLVKNVALFIEQKGQVKTPTKLNRSRNSGQKVKRYSDEELLLAVADGGDMAKHVMMPPRCISLGDVIPFAERNGVFLTWADFIKIATQPEGSEVDAEDYIRRMTQRLRTAYYRQFKATGIPLSNRLCYSLPLLKAVVFGLKKDHDIREVNARFLHRAAYAGWGDTAVYTLPE